MTWSSLPPHVRDTALKVCTAKEIDALKLFGSGYSNRGAARVLGITAPTYRERLARALNKIAAATSAEDVTDSFAA